MNMSWKSARKTSSPGGFVSVSSQVSSAVVVRGKVSETIWFSTERNSMSAIGATKVTSTKIRSGAIKASARSF